MSYPDENGIEKHNLVARKGSGSGGLGFFSHSGTVPGDPLVTGSSDQRGQALWPGQLLT
ncbi:MAG: hypothetical protein R2867_08235 [Caldilineaceae bacterium]